MDKEAFDPEAVFLDTIVEEDVLPTLSLAVDGLTTPVEATSGRFDLSSNDELEEEPIMPSTVMPETKLDPEELEVYGWESSWWRKVRGYLGF